MVRDILSILIGSVISLSRNFTNNPKLRDTTICGILLFFFLTSINQLGFSKNFALEAYPVEVTGKVMIEGPKCEPNEVYDAGKDICVGTPGPGGGPGGPGDNGPGFIESEEPPRPTILTANASDVETEAGGQLIPFQQIVIVNDSMSKDIQSIKSTIQALTDIVENLGAEVIYSYNSAMTGFAFKAPNQQVTDNVIQVLSSDPRVNSIEQDKTVVPFSEEIPTGIQRVDANELYSIPKIGSFTADVDIAIIDSGIDLDNPELNVNSSFSMIVPQIQNAEQGDVDSIINNNIDLDNLGLNTNAAGGNTSSFYPPFATSGASSADDTCGHGTRVAGIAAAKADTQGVVGIAPNARLWAVKVLDYNKFTGKCEGSISSVIAAIEYITRLKDQIDVVNLSLGCKCNSSALDDAISRSVKADITYVVAAGNMNVNASSFSPANHKDGNNQKDVITVSAMTDLDGKCGGHSSARWVRAGDFAGLYDDDAFAKFSNYGSVVDIAAPGVMIKSTSINGSYSLGNGTSIAAPHVAGAAALYKILNPSSTPYDVRHALITDGIRSTTVCDGLRHGYFEKDSDGVGEPLLYVDDLVKKVKQRYEDTTAEQPESVVSRAANESANATGTAIEQPESVVSRAANESANATGTASNQSGNPVLDELKNIFGGITGNK
jgi:subtilisin family serine protease